MRLRNRSFPHPVVGNLDDVPGAKFQADREMTTDKQNIYIDVEVVSSNNTINDLISAGKAAYVVHVECSNTLFRRAYEFSSATHRIAISMDDLNGPVEVNTFARSRRPMNAYKVQKAHADYESAAFTIAVGDILAVAEGEVFYIESDFDALKNIGSIIEIRESDNQGDHPMRAQFDSEKIVIFLCKADFALYKELRANEAVTAALSGLIVLPALTEALRLLQDGEEDDTRWRQRLRFRVESLDLDLENGEPLELAQKLLELPLKRALLSTKSLAENAGTN